MKRITLFFACAAIFASCQNKSETNNQAKAEAYKQITDSIRLDSFQTAQTKELEIAQQKEQALALQTKQASSSSTGRRTYVKGVSETYSNPQPAKKGWGKAAKGAAIGAGAGAVTGVIVSKKDGRGAVIGGLAGAGAGYVIGRSQDKKDGRVQ